ncbi:hypothetical protein IFU23_06480 [Pantoea agglomerans]|uniref:Uncharacterized protein n=1 Tax=Enterobacter agglomerans TaxID=549 RepID=A0ACC5PWI1_ENTAG|nr:hypothetical protein [Pantoea agglomerans]AZI53407.1 hypothetical protein CBF16_21420 [Pantoea agglomerans]MBD8129410.1 hypothetical protein [Pantoea agglomerans]MBD8153799.1 hypothetical protein [Pantoea agglomerans]MBD8154855.1 hypothetical protein [Pantoea agglomerans]MBD8157753.1 hypothetical protein [Pantoea agglomerans]
MERKVMLVLFMFSLTGCVEYKWVKDGADPHQEDIAETQCKAQALKDLPPDNEITDRYTSKDKKTKTTDTSYSTSDANESSRDILVKDCMYRKGWKQIEVQH